MNTILRISEVHAQLFPANGDSRVYRQCLEFREAHQDDGYGTVLAFAFATRARGNATPNEREHVVEGPPVRFDPRAVAISLPTLDPAKGEAVRLLLNKLLRMLAEGA